MSKSKGLKQAYDLRDIAAGIVSELATAPEFTPALGQRAKAIADGIRAWAEADEHIRIHRGKPLPTAATMKARAPKRRREPGPSAASMIASEAPAEPAPAPATPDPLSPDTGAGKYVPASVAPGAQSPSADVDLGGDQDKAPSA